MKYEIIPPNAPIRRGHNIIKRINKIMTHFTGKDANMAIMNFLFDYGNDLPEYQRNKMREVVMTGNPVQQLITSMEGLYAIRENSFEEANDLLIGLSDFITDKGFSGQGERASLINAVAMRIADGGKAIEDNDVAISDDMIEAEEAEVDAEVEE